MNLWHSEPPGVYPFRLGRTISHSRVNAHYPTHKQYLPRNRVVRTYSSRWKDWLSPNYSFSGGLSWIFRCRLRFVKDRKTNGKLCSSTGSKWCWPVGVCCHGYEHGNFLEALRLNLLEVKAVDLRALHTGHRPEETLAQTGRGI